MANVRVYNTVEIDRRKHVATAVSPPPGVEWMVVIARADGTEPVVVCEVAGQPVHCTCGATHGGECNHFVALRKAAVLQLNPVAAKSLGFFARAQLAIERVANGGTVAAPAAAPRAKFMLAAG